MVSAIIKPSFAATSVYLESGEMIKIQLRVGSDWTQFLDPRRSGSASS
ncbi:MAG: hypothetical protein OJF47_003832 [Nitrospira sp.]|nr:MAG: hypothetical protein OJF47_003832 [Nitrospira sp.]